MTQRAIPNPAFDFLVAVSQGDRSALEQLGKNLEAASRLASTISPENKRQFFMVSTTNEAIRK